MIRESLRLRDSDRGGKRWAFTNLLIHSCLTYREICRSKIGAEAGEEIVLIGRKATISGEIPRSLSQGTL